MGSEVSPLTTFVKLHWQYNEDTFFVFLIILIKFQLTMFVKLHWPYNVFLIILIKFPIHVHKQTQTTLTSHETPKKTTGGKDEPNTII